MNSATRARKGDWCQTYSGRAVWPLDPEPEDFVIEDIAHHLALANRFAGATYVPYSVAQHSVLVSRQLPPHLRRQGLFHDAPEFILADLVRPVKRQPELAAYDEIEARMLAAMGARFGFSTPLAPEVKEADLRMCATEKYWLMAPEPMPWGLDVAMYLDGPIMPWDWREAEQRFLEEYYFLRLQGW